MYHIKPDKRSQTSAKLIGNAMLACLERKKFENITIVDLQKESTVGRATFYRLFDRTEDVLEWLYEEQLQEVNKKYQEIPREKRPSFMQYFLDFYYENSGVVEQLIKAQKLDVLLRVHQKNIPWVLEMFSVTDESRVENFDYYSATFTALLIAALMVWTSHGKRETPEELNQIIREQMQIAMKIYG